jgi:hypothetical protein
VDFGWKWQGWVVQLEKKVGWQVSQEAHGDVIQLEIVLYQVDYRQNSNHQTMRAHLCHQQESLNR